MQVLPFILAASFFEAPLPVHYTSDALGGIEDGWSQVAHRREGPCAIDVTGNGMFFRITMSGFQPGELGRFHLANGNIKPIRYRFKTDRSGEFSKIYVPFRPMRRGGTVSVNAGGEDCDVSVSFPWQRAKVGVH